MEGKNEANVRKYRVLSSIYDWSARNPLLERPRRRQFELAHIQPGDRVLIVGVGTCRETRPPRARPLTSAIGDTRLRTARHERDRLVDIIGLVPAGRC